METRAHHVLIGVFVLMMLAGLVSMIVWVAKVDIDREYDFYSLYFDGPVTGLSRAGDVRFNGIYVGTVRNIELDERDASRVKVVVRVFRGTPVTKRSVATLEVLGLTGVAFVQIRSDALENEYEEGAPPIPEGEDYPVIPSKVGGIQELVTTAPELLNRGIVLLARLSEMVRAENIVKIDKILSHVEVITGSFAGESSEIGEAIQHLNSVLGRIDTMVSEDISPLVKDIRAAASSFKSLSENLDGTIADNRGAITSFTSTALPEFAQFASDARRVAASLARIAERIEEDPAAFLFSEKTPEVEAK